MNYGSGWTIKVLDLFGTKEAKSECHIRSFFLLICAPEAVKSGVSFFDLVHYEEPATHFPVGLYCSPNINALSHK
jgi:hypothetical protein